MIAAFKMLAPLARLATIAGAIVLLLLLILGALGFRWDPLGLSRRSLERAEAQAEAGRAEAAARRSERQAEAAQARRIDDFQQQQTAAGRSTAAAVEQARRAEDAELLIESRRAERLRGHDRELCRLAPDLQGCTAPPDPAGGGETPLRLGDLAP